MKRIMRHPIIDSEILEEVQILVDGRPVMARRGEILAAALLSAGKNVFRLTPKRKEPRGVFCGIGQCNDCVMVVNGVPNVRTCVTRVEADMVVQTQEGLGTLGGSND